MATQAHCLFCFEVLVASYDDERKTATLQRMQDLWELYLTSRLPRPGGGQQGDDEDEQTDNDDDDDDDDDDETDNDMDEQASDPDDEPVRAPIPRSRPARLAGLSSATSSGMSTPSSVSAASSSRTTPLTLPSSSSNSSRSSLFSMRNPSRASQQRPVEPSRPLFVTWSAVGRAGHKSLRGCIGTFEAQPIETGLRNYALTS